MVEPTIEAQEASAEFLVLRQLAQGVSVRISAPLTIPADESTGNLLCVSNKRGLVFAATNEGEEKMPYERRDDSLEGIES